MRCSVSWRSMRLFALFLRHSFSRGSKRLSPQDWAPPHLRKCSSVSFVVLHRGHNGDGQELYWCSLLCISTIFLFFTDTFVITVPGVPLFSELGGC